MIGFTGATATTWCVAVRDVTSSSWGEERTGPGLWLGETTASKAATVRLPQRRGGTDLLDGGDGTDTCKRGEHVLECEPVVFDWATAEWDGSHKGQPLDLTGYKKTFDDNFDSLIDHHGRRHRLGALVRAGATGYVPGALRQPHRKPR